jgi:hypothetical protein
MQPTNDQLTSNASPMAVFNFVLGMIKERAEQLEDGNTIALTNRIARDVASLKPEYQNLSFKDLQDHRAQEEEPVSEQDPAFVAQSYNRAQNKDVNQAPYPNTGEDASAPFVNKGEIKNEALKNANSSEEKGSPGSESGKVVKAKTIS